MKRLYEQVAVTCDDDDPVWSFIIRYVQNNDAPLHTLAPSVRQSFDKLYALFQNGQYGMVVSGSVTFWVHQKMPGHWTPNDIDVFCVGQAGEQQKSLLEQWLQERKWSREVLQTAHENLDSLNNGYVISTLSLSSERWISPLDEKKSFNLVTINKDKDAKLTFKNVNLQQRFDIRQCGRTWPVTDTSHNWANTVSTICMKAQRDSPDIVRRAHKYQHRVGTDPNLFRVDSRFIQTTSTKETVVHVYPPINVEGYGIGISSDIRRNKGFEEKGPYCFRDLYKCKSRGLESKVDEKKGGTKSLSYEWRPELFALRCRDRQCGSVVWEDPFAWHCHNEQQLVIVHSCNLLHDEEANRESMCARADFVTTVLPEFPPELVVSMLEYLEPAQLCELVWPFLSRYRVVPHRWSRFLSLPWLIRMVKAAHTRNDPVWPVSFSFNQNMRDGVSIVPIDELPTAETAFCVLVIQQLVHRELLIVNQPFSKNELDKCDFSAFRPLYPFSFLRGRRSGRRSKDLGSIMKHIPNVFGFSIYK